MSRILEVPDAVYAALQQTGEASGMTPVDWIAARLQADVAPPTASAGATSARSLADLFRGRVGRIHSGGGENLSENAGREFGEYVEAKRQSGHL